MSNRAPDNLERGAATFRERNATYGDNYRSFGVAMQGLFPQGLHIDPHDTAAFNRLGLIVQCLSKLTRYAHQLPAGGHADSAHDLMVYAAMLEELTKEQKQ